MTKTKQTNNTALILGLAFAAVLIIVAGGYYVVSKTSETSNVLLPVAVGSDGYQEVRMKVIGLDYEPSTLAITAGQKVRWIIDATNAQGCARTMVSPAIGVKQPLKSGENIIEFTAPAAGTIQFSCSMGMTSGQFQVV